MAAALPRGADRVVVPFSDLASGARALEALLHAPRADVGEVELVALVDPLRPGKVAVFVNPARAAADATAAAEHWLATLGARLTAAGVRWHGRVALGPRSASLRALAARPGVARIVLATPTGAPWLRWWRRLLVTGHAGPVTVVA